jgi:molecular chaperone GrpE (heat shock protein)
MLDIEALMWWNRNKGQKKFIHICKYQTSANEESSETEQWMGKIRSLKNEISNIKDSVEHKLAKMQIKTRVQQKGLKEKIQNVSSKVKAKL